MKEECEVCGYVNEDEIVGLIRNGICGTCSKKEDELGFRLERRSEKESSQQPEVIQYEEITEELKPIKKTLETVYFIYAVLALLGVMYLIAGLFSYYYADRAKGTWLESHYRWLSNTFWLSLLWFSIASGLVYFIVTNIAVAMVFYPATWLIGEVLVYLLLAPWVIFRVLKGLRFLSAGRRMYFDDSE